MSQFGNDSIYNKCDHAMVEELVNFLRDRSNFLIERNPLIILNGSRRDVESDVIHQRTYFRVD